MVWLAQHLSMIVVKYDAAYSHMHQAVWKNTVNKLINCLQIVKKMFTADK